MKELRYGRDMVTHIVNHTYGDKEEWHLPKGVTIELDVLYKIGYKYYDASDPMDSSCSYHVTFIEKVPDDICKDIIEYKRLKKKVDEYLNIK